MSARFSAVGLAALGVMLAGPAAVAQGRFNAISRETVAAAHNLQIVTIHDTVQNACYLLFQTVPTRTAGRRFASEPSDVENAATFRDHQLAELNAAYEQGFTSLYPGTPPLSLLRFQWEGWKVQSEYERVVRENELSWLEDALDRLAAASVTVSGPVPCGARPQNSSLTDNQR